MKESMERLVVWAKAHPYIAGALVIAVVVLAYITIKRGGGGGGFSGSTISDVSNDAPLGSSDLSDLDVPSSGGGGGSSTDEAGNSMPSPVTTGEGSPAGGGSNSGGFESLENQPVDYAADIPPVTYAIAAGVPVASMQSNSLLGATATGGVKKATAADDVKKQISATATGGVKGGAVKQVSKPIQATATGGVKGGVVKQVSKPIQAVATGGVKSTPKTHAELAGLYKYYTGTSKGVRYLLGYRASSSGTTKAR